MKQPGSSLIWEVVKAHLARTGNAGDGVGSGGHLGFVALSINTISDPKNTGDGWQVTFDYTITIETEFTTYPDNPPMQQRRSGELLITDELVAAHLAQSKEETRRKNDEDGSWDFGA